MTRSHEIRVFRCLAVRVAAPTHEEVCSVLSCVSKKEGLSLPSELAMRIAEKSNRNLRRAILMLQSCKVAQYPFQPDQDIVDLDWEVSNLWITTLSTLLGILETQFSFSLLIILKTIPINFFT